MGPNESAWRYSIITRNSTYYIPGNACLNGVILLIIYLYHTPAFTQQVGIHYL